MSAAHVSALDPNHPHVRKVMKLVEGVKLDHMPLDASDRRAWRLYWASRLILLDAQHIASARPRVEYDEAAQERISFHGDPVGRLNRPKPSNALLPVFERAVELQMAGDDGREGDSDADAETGDDMPAPPPASRGTSQWRHPLDRKSVAAGEAVAHE